MAESSESGSSSTNNLINAGLAILTLVGGFYYIKGRSLTSDRPVAQPVEEKAFGEQTVDARLWEDPFKETKEEKQPARSIANVIVAPGDTNGPPEVNPELEGLIHSITNRSDRNSVVVLLPVMLEGGGYSEDRESRIRSRIAVVAGLGVRGFVPDDAEHVGRVLIPWPKSVELENAEKSFGDVSRSNATASFLAQLPAKSDCPLDLRYEWFIPRQFYPDSAHFARSTNVLVLWLKESFFDDDPLVRLPLLLYRLRQTNHLNEGNDAPVELIGPRSSLTLRNMLPGQFPALNDYPGPGPVHSNNVSHSLAEILHHIDIFCACPSAMDEVLVSSVTRIPRQTVGEALTNAGFHSFHNFSATDAQLAQEAYDEFQLRQADLSQPSNHLVLVAEWDTFYSRMISLTFQAQLQVRLDTNTPPHALRQYINQYRTSPDTNAPPNFHRFYYLRGLDGEMALSDTDSGKAGSSEGNKSRPDSPEAFRQWQPDANKAEGPSQLDYVARLGDRLQAINEELRRTNAGQIKVIGVVGSDVYDTLIILQALRARFPETLFFTTDLDARFWHPKELKWSRNLLVFSGYGLALAPDLQHAVSPFRDSEQTAQYAATLAALGDTNLIQLQSVPPRRFEIGRHGAVDLSVLPGVVEASELASSGHPGFRLHPATVSESWQKPAGQPQLRLYLLRKFFWIVVVLATAAVLLCLLSEAAKTATWGWPKFLGESLDYGEEDFGGPDGAVVLWERLEREQNSFCKWMLAELKAEFKRVSDADFLERLKIKQEKLRSLEHEIRGIRRLRDEPEQTLDQEKESRQEKDLTRKEESKQKQELEVDGMHEALVRAMVVTFNRILTPERNAKLNVDQFDGEDRVTGLTRNNMDSLAQGSEEKPRRRELLDKFLEKLSVSIVQAGPAPGDGDHTTVVKKLKHEALNSATAARMATVDTVECLRRQRIWVVGLLLFAVVLGGLLSRSMWWDTFYNPIGQPLSFGNGASAWPAQICRFLALIAAIYFCIAIYYRRRLAFADITRKFRLSRDCPNDVPSGRICAVKTWFEYTKPRNWRKCIADIFLPFGLYILFCVFIVFAFSSGQLPLNPVRGTSVSAWNFWLLIAAVICFLLLTFLTIDGARRGRKFILVLAAAPTEYPHLVRRHFARLNGKLDESYLDEWIDVQLIAELTEKMGGIVYYPSVVFGLLLIARNETWAQWSWPPYLLTIFGLNLLVAVASVLILQLAAGKAKRLAIANLKAKVKRLQNIAAPSKAESNASQAEKLLDEINAIRRGAFARAWESPLFGAMLLPSGGLTLVQALIWALGH